MRVCGLQGGSRLLLQRARTALSALTKPSESAGKPPENAASGEAFPGVRLNTETSGPPPRSARDERAKADDSDAQVCAGREVVVGREGNGIPK